MTLRFKWYKLWLPEGLPQVTKALKRAPMSAQVQSGFRMLREDGDGTFFRFTWRSTVSTTSFDDEGNPSVRQIETTNFVDLKFFSLGKSVFLRIDNPGKSLRSLMNEIGALAGFGFSTQPIVFSDVQRPGFFSEFDHIKLVGIKLINVAFDHHVVGRVELASKDGIDLTTLGNVTGRSYVVDTAVYDVLSRMVRGQLSFNKTGLVRVSDRLSHQFLSVFEPTLEEFLGAD